MVSFCSGHGTLQKEELLSILSDIGITDRELPGLQSLPVSAFQAATLPQGRNVPCCHPSATCIVSFIGQGWQQCLKLQMLGLIMDGLRLSIHAVVVQVQVQTSF